MDPITLVLAESQSMMRYCLRCMLEQTADLTVIAEASSVVQTLQEVTAHNPQVAIIDVDLPDIGGIHCCQEIVSLNNDTKVLLLAATDLDSYLFHAWQAGAYSFIPKTSDIDKLVLAIRQVTGGQRQFTPDQLHRIQFWQQEVETRLEKLTCREREVLSLLVRAYTNRRIAQELAISEKAAEFHVSRILAKLEVRSRHDVVAWIQRRGIRYGLKKEKSKDSGRPLARR